MNNRDSSSRSGEKMLSRDEKIRINKETVLKRRKRRERLFGFFIIVFVLAVATVLSLTVFFKIENIEISGSVIYTPEQITQAGELSAQENLFMFNSSRAAEKICTVLPYVGKTEIKKKFPNKIIVTVTDTAAALAIFDGMSYIVMNGDCKVLEVGCVLLPEGCAVVTGFECVAAQPGQIIEPAETEKFELLLLMASSAREVGMTGITGYDITEATELKMIYQNRFTILIGNSSSLTEKLRRGWYAIQDEAASRQTAVIDLTLDGKAYIRDEVHTTAPATMPDGTPVTAPATVTNPPVG